VRLTREANLLPYFVSLVLGLLLGWRQTGRVRGRLGQLTGVEAASLAFQQVAILALVIFSFMFASQDRSISRLFLGSFLVLAWLLLLGLHQELPRRLAGLYSGRGQRVPTLFVGWTGGVARVQDWMAQRAHLGVQPVGYVGVAGQASEAGGGGTERPREAAMTFLPLDGLASTWPQPVAATREALLHLLERHQIGQVIMMDLPGSDAEARLVVEACQARGCRLLLRHDIEERLGHPVVSTAEDGQHFFTLHEEPLEEPLNRALKRAFDIAVALPVVVLVLPPLALAVWLGQRVQSPGPLFHNRPRAGVGRAEFHMVKFRTMHPAEADAQAESRQARKDDDRVFPLGRFLRRHSLDEFPQFWNVLIGDMSVVGPRPVMPKLDEEFERQARAYRTRHLVKPGITGLAQSEGLRGEITAPEQLQARVRLDLYYIAHWSIWLDLQITAKTLAQVFFPPKSAY